MPERHTTDALRPSCGGDFTALIERLTEKAKSAPQMVQAMVELTYGCNLRCVHCYNPTHEAKNELTTEQFKTVLGGLAKEGCLWVGFTGGELWTRRDAFEIMSFAKTLGMQISLVTNATLVTDAIAEKIRMLQPYQVDVSLYGATEQTYEAVTQTPGSFAHFVRGVEALRARGIPMTLKLIIMTLNRHELGEMITFAESRGLPYRLSTEIHPRVDGLQAPLDYRLPAKEAFEIWQQTSGEPDRIDWKRDHAESDRCGSAGELFDCLCGKSNAAVTPQGKMNLCLSIYRPQYDLLEGSVAQGWSRLVNTVQDQKPDQAYECHSCEIARHCTRGAMDGWLEQGKFDAACIPHFREIAEAKASFLERSPITKLGDDKLKGGTHGKSNR